MYVLKKRELKLHLQSSGQPVQYIFMFFSF